MSSVARPARGTRLELRAIALPLLVVTAMAAVAGLGFQGALAGWSFAWAPAAGAIGAALVTGLATWRRLLVGEAVAVSLVGFAVVGILVIGGAPTPAAARAFLEGIVSGWADLLTSFTPADVTAQFLALPFTISWLGGLIGGELLRSTRVPGLPALGPIVAMAASLLFSVGYRAVSLAQGVTIVIGTLVLGLVQQHQLRSVEDDLTTGSVHRFRGRGLAIALVLLIGTTALSPVLGPRLPGADARERFDLRDHLTPPFDPLRVPSPLVGIKGQLLEAREDVPVFTVSAEEPIRRWTTAVLGAYDGVVWTVAESLASGAGQFRQVDSRLPAPPDGAALPPDPRTVRAEVEISNLDGVWVPRPGWPIAVTFPEAQDVRFNDLTGNTAIPHGLSEGMSYEVAALAPPVTSADGLSDVTVDVQDTVETDLSALPPVVRSLAADLLEGRDLGWAQVEAIREGFLDTETSYYDAEETPPGHSYFRLSEFLSDPGRRVGYEEQYAAAAAVIARVADLPARVAVGYLVPDDRWQDGVAEVVAGDASAWLEVRTEEFGWVPVEVTPDNPSDPDTAEEGRIVEDVQIPNPPPPPPPPPDVDPPDREELDDLEAEEPEDEGGLSINPVLLAVGAGVGGPLLAFGLFALAVILLKRRRRAQRFTAPVPARRIAGAWSEVTDRYREAGSHPSNTATTRERALTYGEHTVDADGGATTMLLSLADEVDRAAFSPILPSDEDAETAWRLSDGVAQQLLDGRSRTQRWRMRLDPRPLVHRDESRAAHHLPGDPYE